MTVANAPRLPRKIDVEILRGMLDDCSVLIVAAGFEKRARRLTELVGQRRPNRTILVRYPTGIDANDRNFDRMQRTLASPAGADEVVVLELDWRQSDDYHLALREKCLEWRPDVKGEVWIDVSALPMQGICATLAAVREAFPENPVRILYTEAAEYFPTRDEVRREEARKVEARRKGLNVAREVLSPLSQEMNRVWAPKLFSGSATANLSCLIVFPGFEQHRSLGVIDALNPSKLVLVFARPERKDLEWRLKLSRDWHQSASALRPTSFEIVSTLGLFESFGLMDRYYGYLFADHNVVVSPICTKMQCVASYLLWERYRDVQLAFALPVSYMPDRASRGWRDTFELPLPTPSQLAEHFPSVL